MSEAITSNPILAELALPGAKPMDGLPMAAGTDFDQALRQFIQGQTGKGDGAQLALAGIAKLLPDANAAEDVLQQRVDPDVSPLSQALARLQWLAAKGQGAEGSTEDTMAQTLVSASDQAEVEADETLTAPPQVSLSEALSIEQADASTTPLAGSNPDAELASDAPQTTAAQEPKEANHGASDIAVNASPAAPTQSPVLSEEASATEVVEFAKAESTARPGDGMPRQMRANRPATEELATRGRFSRESLASSSTAEEIPEDEDWRSRLDEVLDAKQEVVDAAQSKKQEMQPTVGVKGMQVREVALQLNPTQDAEAVDPPALGQTESPRGAPLTQGASGSQTLTLNTPIHKEGWGDAFGARVTWMIKNEMQGAEVRLNPPHLGHIHVRIDITDDQASVTFQAQHGVVRDAVEAAIPKLREMLAESGLNLANVDISQQHSGHHGQGQGAQDNRLSGEVIPEYGGGEVDDDEVETVITSDGMVDYFA